MIIPGQSAPSLRLATIAGGHFDLQADDAAWLTLVCFYRGAHCAICRRYLSALTALLPAFSARGVKVIAVSMDHEERARVMADTIGSQDLQIAYGLTLESARQWGLYLSSHRGKTSTGMEEAELFNEPAMFLIKPASEVYFAALQSMPFARPPLAEILHMVDYAKSSQSPGRGELVLS